MAKGRGVIQALSQIEWSRQAKEVTALQGGPTVSSSIHIHRCN